MRHRVAGLVVLGCIARATAAQEPESRIAYRNDRLSVTVTATPLAEVLAEIQRVTGAAVGGEAVAAREVTMQFDDLALAEGLQRLLGEQNFTIRYGERGRVAAIELKGRPEEPRTPAPALTTATTGPPPTAVSLPRRFLRHRPVPVPERLAEVLGSDTATFEQLFDAATTAEDGVVRAQAMMVTLSALERERALRRTLTRSLRGKDDTGLGPFLHSRGALEMLEFFAAHSREPGLQKKASVRLQQLRSDRATGKGG